MNMFSNHLKIISKTPESINKLKANTSWKQKDILYQLVNDFIPKKITDIIPVNNFTFKINWKNEQDFFDLLQNNIYIEIVNLFKEYEIHLVWV